MNIGSGFFTLYKITQRTVFFETGCIHVLEGSVTGSGRRIKDLWVGSCWVVLGGSDRIIYQNFWPASNSAT